jgi:hypothetical protein
VNIREGVQFAGAAKGQSIAIVLGAMATCSWPVLVDLTDGQYHHLLTLKGNDLMVWQNLPPTKAYHKIAQELKADTGIQGLSLTSRAADLDNAPDDEIHREVKKLRSNIRVVSALKEQLDSVLPFLPAEEKYQTAFEIIATHMASSADGPCDGGEGYLGMYT